MDLKDRPSTVQIDTPREVDVEAIDRELTQLWKQAADGSDAESGSPVVRACSMNFIVVTEHAGEVDAIADLVGQVTVEHPSRIQVVSLDRRAGTPSLEAWISARCSIPEPGGSQICCEQINLVAAGTEVRAIPNLVTSLLVADVPTVVLWKATVDASDNILAALVHVADRAFIDSSAIAEPEIPLRSWLQVVAANRGPASFGDLAWTHLTEWRSLLAQTFQPPDMRRQLRALEAVDVEYSFTAAPPHSGLSQSILLIGWLAHALGWQVTVPLRREEGNGYGARLAGSRPVRIRIAPRSPTGGGGGGPEVISLRAGAAFRVSLEWLEERGCVLLVRTLDGGSREETVRTVRKQTEAELMARELEVLQPDRIYDGTLRALGPMMMDNRQ